MTRTTSREGIGRHSRGLNLGNVRWNRGLFCSSFHAIHLHWHYVCGRAGFLFGFQSIRQFDESAAISASHVYFSCMVFLYVFVIPCFERPKLCAKLISYRTHWLVSRASATELHISQKKDLARTLSHPTPRKNMTVHFNKNIIEMG